MNIPARHFQRPRAGAAAAAILLLHLSWACASPSPTALQRDRSNAFIGYHESTTYAACVDQLGAQCITKASEGQCLSDPHVTRALCPVACNLPPCRSVGTHQVRKRVLLGAASPTGTWAYAKAMRSVVARNHFSEVTAALALNASEGVGPPPPSPAGNAQQQVPAVRLPATLLLSSLGIGTYLGAADDDTDEAVTCAVLHSVTHGWNVLDTAPNYREGRGESAIGAALEALLVGSSSLEFWRDGALAKGTFGGKAGEQVQTPPDITRDMIFVSTKAGYLPEGLADQLLTDGSVNASHIVGGNCLHPECISASVTQSLQRLRLATVDLLYLHNAAEAQLAVLGRQAFMGALRAAFERLEALRSRRLIQAYGMATWDCFRSEPGSPQHLSLQEVVDLARQVGGSAHGFRAVQLPVNAQMAEAWAQPWQGLRNETATAEAAAAAAAAGSVEAARPAGDALGGSGGAEAAGTGAAAASNATGAQGGVGAAPPLRFVSLVEAARELGVAVFTSGPLLEGELLRAAPEALEGIPSLATLPSHAAKLLQVARSTPGIATALVGHKAREHVLDNMAVGLEPRLAPKRWRLVQRQVALALRQRQQQ